jgi:hypothetical protein
MEITCKTEEDKSSTVIVYPLHFDFLLEKVENCDEDVVNLSVNEDTVKAKSMATATMTLIEVMEAISVKSFVRIAGIYITDQLLALM